MTSPEEEAVAAAAAEQAAGERAARAVRVDLKPYIVPAASIVLGALVLLPTAAGAIARPFTWPLLVPIAFGWSHGNEAAVVARSDR